MNLFRNQFGLLLGAGILLMPTLAAQPWNAVDGGRPLQVNPAGRHPDLVVTEISGPAEAYVGDTVLVNVAVDNLGDPLGNGYTYRADIVLSADLSVDAGDPVLGSFVVSQTNLGLQGLSVVVPQSFGAGNYYWGLRIADPVPGDENPDNNAKLGNLVDIVRTDLALDDGAPITAFARVPDPVGPVATVRVDNVGTDQSIMVYSVLDLNAVPWLNLDPVSGISVSGAEGSDIHLEFIHTGLLPGDYFTTLRFTNNLIPTDTQDLAIQLTVGEAYFTPGHVFEGQITGAGDVDKITFHGIKGMVLTLRTKSLTGSIKPVLTVVDPDGVVENVLMFKYSGTYVNKKVKLKKSGLYSVEVTGKGITTGSYRVKTDRKVPTKAKPRTRKLMNPSGGGDGDLDILILPGAILEYKLNPNSKFAGPLNSTLTTPLGAPFDVSGNTETNANGSVVVSDLHLGEAGKFVIGVTGWGANPKAKVVIQVLPVQPPRAEGTIYLP